MKTHGVTGLRSAGSECKSAERASDESIISVEKLVKEYGDEDGVRAVDGVDFEIERGTAVGILGPNGAGKTTVIKCMLGLVIPTAGKVRVGGVDVGSEPDLAYRRIGATLEGARNTYWRLTVRENLDFFAAIAGNDPRERRDRHDELLAQFGLREKADTVVRELSRGQKQKASLASTLARGADFLFLDEPTLGLDVESSLELRRELKRLVDDETTVLLTSHDMDIIEDVCDRVIIMNRGRIVTDDTVEDLLQLFETKRYEISVTGPFTTALKDRLRTEFNACGFQSRADRTQFRASVTGDEFYGLVDALRGSDLVVHSFEGVDADLEHVFLELTEATSEKSPANNSLELTE